MTGKGKGNCVLRVVEASGNDNVKAQTQDKQNRESCATQNARVMTQPCPYVDVRLTDAQKDSSVLTVPKSFGAPAVDVSVLPMEQMANEVAVPRASHVVSSPVIEYIPLVTSVTYVAPAPVVEYISPVTSVTYVAPAPVDSSFPGSSADMYIKDSGKKSNASFDEYITSFKGGLFSELFSRPAAYSIAQKDSPWPLRLVLLVPAPEPPAPVPPDAATLPPPSGGDSGGGFCPSPRGKGEFEEIETISWEQYLLEKMWDKDKEKEKVKATEEGNIDLWEVYMQRKKKKGNVEKGKENLKESEKDQGREKVKDAREEKENLQDKRMAEQGGKVLRRRAKLGQLDARVATWARAEALGREVRALLFPGRLKRKLIAYERGYRLNVVTNSSCGKAGRVTAKLKPKEVFIFGQCEPDCSSVASEILYKGETVMQVGEVPIPPEPETSFPASDAW